MLLLLVAGRAGYPEHAWLARSDALTLGAVLIQVGMVLSRLETIRELKVIVVFHVVGTVMELFKTDVGSWRYDVDGVLHIAGVPLYTGFMYAAIGSYMVRTFRLFDLRFAAYPPRRATALVAALIYVNFFTHHFAYDLRWVLLAAVIAVYARTVMHFHVWRFTLRMPILVAFTLVALFIWFAENIGTASGAWLYPDQVHGWHPVSPEKIVAWFLLMMISVALVTWVYPPQPPASAPPAREAAPAPPGLSASSYDAVL
jgi:uncharacterized membrane protein YoaT (DUF817 family)